ncbi:conserved hypothetical protein [Mucor ambiguus]|uniref:Fork-head domain-containing protein n=1 Tax=Mucor ambiguus TaxID=91626 RepID=A0A0C9MLM5_9FUNG|nr:conserved hypothetical protein [Mucor ambiguus]
MSCPNMSDYCFQPTKSFPIVHEKQRHHSSPPSQQYQQPQKKPNELKFKIESVGIHPEDDDDLDMCPARVRPSWPKQIIPWWVPSRPNEKPPYSYATLIAHAILASKDGRLTLNDIYTWISKNYPTFSVGNGGWQNSIRHNLSLNKKWFYKIDRRPTQANPGKGCYWTLIAGTEQIFIDNLTQEGGHSRKHHDIGLTAELSIGQRRGACYYNHINAVTPTTPTTSTTTPSLIHLDTPPPTPTKPLLSPLYTTFRMVDMAPKAADDAAAVAALDDSDNDSGVDVCTEYVDRKHFRKRRRTNTASVTTTPSTSAITSMATPTTTSATTTTPTMTFGMEQLHVNNHHQSMVYGTPTSTCVPSFESINYEINHWVERSLTCADRQRPQPSQSWTEPMQQLTTTSYKRQHPITIHLDDEEVTQKYLHFEDDEEEHHPTHNNNVTNLMLTTSLNSNDLSFNTLYPSHSLPPPQQHQSSSYNNMPLQPHYQLSQFVSMQDILYS